MKLKEDGKLSVSQEYQFETCTPSGMDLDTVSDQCDDANEDTIMVAPLEDIDTEMTEVNEAATEIDEAAEGGDEPAAER